MSLYDRLVAIKDSPQALVADAIIFFSYFGVSAYAGSIAYQNAYNDAFRFSILQVNGYFDAITFFLSKLVFSWAGCSAIVIFSMSFIVIYLLLRYLFRPWFSYILLSLYIVTSFVACLAIGLILGTRAATSDKSISSSTLPPIKISSTSAADVQLDSSNERLLFDSKDWIYVFEPLASGSVVKIIALQKKNLNYYEVTAK